MSEFVVAQLSVLAAARAGDTRAARPEVLFRAMVRLAAVLHSRRSCLLASFCKNRYSNGKSHKVYDVMIGCLRTRV